MHPEKTRKCIYCLQTKPVSDFNREHVISRFMGTYENAVVLNHNEVCKECNDFFCENLENALSFDSLEGLLRTERLPKKMKTQRAIDRTRLQVTVS
ncbi:MAG: HNH endonuclease [Peptococcaceae bacterium]|nr:HNH endonuclease [Peptococcaceae bacterium]